MTHSAEKDAGRNVAPWECPRCGKTATVNLDVLSPLGYVRCTCGATSRPLPPGKGSA